MEVAAGPAATATLEGPSAGTSEVALSSGPQHERRLLKAAAVQLRDACGNAVPCEGVPLRWVLEHDGPPPQGSALPDLGCSEGEVAGQSDGAGRLFFGDLGVLEGTGAAVSRCWRLGDRP